MHRQKQNNNNQTKKPICLRQECFVTGIYYWQHMEMVKSKQISSPFSFCFQTLGKLKASTYAEEHPFCSPDPGVNTLSAALTLVSTCPSLVRFSEKIPFHSWESNSSHDTIIQVLTYPPKRDLLFATGASKLNQEQLPRTKT